MALFSSFFQITQYFRESMVNFTAQCPLRIIMSLLHQSLKGIPFSGANLNIIQKQKVSPTLVLFPLNSLHNICAYQLGYC